MLQPQVLTIPSLQTTATMLIPRRVSRKPGKRCAYELCADVVKPKCERQGCRTKGPHFHPGHKGQVFCCKSCAQLSGWSSNAEKRLDYNRKFVIDKQELTYRMNELGQDCKMIAKMFHKDPATVYRKAKAYGIKPHNAFTDYRRIYAPKDKDLFLLKVDHAKSADVEVILKAIFHEQRLNHATSLEMFEAMLVPTAS